MRIHKEGKNVIAWNVALSLVIIIAVNLLLPQLALLQYLAYALLLLGNIWAISFFRVPKRVINQGDNAILSAADGKIVAIEEVIEDEYFKDQRLLVSVFMSPMNVHVNWYPFHGKVVYTKYHPGKFLVAYHPKSSVLNERSSIVLEHSNGNAVLMRQVAGFVARRIVFHAKEGDLARQGEEFGIIRFGSRVDFFLPCNVELKVKLGDKVRGQQTVIALFHK